MTMNELLEKLNRHVMETVKERNELRETLIRVRDLARDEWQRNRHSPVGEAFAQIAEEANTALKPTASATTGRG